MEREVDLAKKGGRERRIIPCKENLLEIDWKDNSQTSSKDDGILFDDMEELGRKLVTEIKKIGKETTTKIGTENLVIGGSLSLYQSN
jgi:hypothetical protein